ncbi:DUF6544 family protein [uncultured Anaerococcus sp.]|uniref:DUF6544 family protein n=1 Tax=uncultured Anaerococcus sp. TaxID=293428 RepID=UPI002600E49E|nr:DUF6544 family protein [uncultured Anaerococcus sp.]
MRSFRKKFMIIIGILLVIIGAIIIYFNISYSPLKNKFNNDLENIINNSKINNNDFTEDDFKLYPHTIQKYLKNNGFIDNRKMNYMNILFQDTNFIQDPKKPKLKIDYDQYNFAKYPARIAYIKSSLFGIPFEGYDYLYNEQAGMKGVIAKNITLFDQNGPYMESGALCTYLAESLFIPSSLLENDIYFKEIDPFNIKATINSNGLSVSGIFTFNENYEMIKFYTEDRALVKDNGTVEHIPWTAKCSEYERNESGINLPKKLQAIWNYPEGDLIYFEGNVKYFEYK